MASEPKKKIVEHPQPALGTPVHYSKNLGRCNHGVVTSRAWAADKKEDESQSDAEARQRLGVVHIYWYGASNGTAYAIDTPHNDEGLGGTYHLPEECPHGR